MLLPVKIRPMAWVASDFPAPKGEVSSIHDGDRVIVPSGDPIIVDGASAFYAMTPQEKKLTAEEILRGSRQGYYAGLLVQSEIAAPQDMFTQTLEPKDFYAFLAAHGFLGVSPERIDEYLVQSVCSKPVAPCMVPAQRLSEIFGDGESSWFPRSQWTEETANSNVEVGYFDWLAKRYAAETSHFPDFLKSDWDMVSDYLYSLPMPGMTLSEIFSGETANALISEDSGRFWLTVEEGKAAEGYSSLTLAMQAGLAAGEEMYARQPETLAREIGVDSDLCDVHLEEQHVIVTAKSDPDLVLVVSHDRKDAWQGERLLAFGSLEDAVAAFNTVVAPTVPTP